MKKNNVLQISRSQNGMWLWKSGFGQIFGEMTGFLLAQLRFCGSIPHCGELSNRLTHPHFTPKKLCQSLA